MIEKPLIWLGRRREAVDGEGVMIEKPVMWKAGMGYTHMRQRKADDVVGTVYCRCNCGLIVPPSEAEWGVRYFSTAHQNKAQAERAKLRYQRKAKDV